LSDKLTNVAELAKANRIDVLRALDQVIPDDPKKFNEIIEKMGQISAVDNGPSPTGSNTNDFKEVAMSKMWMKLAQDDGGKQDGLSMKEMIMMKMIFDPKPEKPSMLEQIMMWKEMKAEDPNHTPSFEVYKQQVEADHKAELEKRDHQFETQLKELRDEIRQKNRDNEISQIRHESNDNMERIKQEVMEGFRAEADRIASRLGGATGPKSKLDVLKDAADEIEQLTGIVNKMAPKFGFTPAQTKEMIDEASKKSGLHGYVQDIKDLLDAGGNVADKIGQLGTKSEIPPPQGRVLESTDVLRPVESQGGEKLYLAPPEEQPVVNVIPPAKKEVIKVE
jgi:DNA-binding transcriptional MerR regulator